MRSTATHRLPLQFVHALAWQELSDAELLGRYAKGRNEDAFAELVRRNGPLVLRACWHVLGETAAAEDAFQATFLLLVRKSGRLATTGSLAGWLHAVAVRTARDARRAEGRRRRREQAHAEPRPTAADDLTWREVRQALDAELAALPEKYRVPLVLCCIQELSYQDAAYRAGCSVAALRGRLERGKKLLRRRLARYGLPAAAPVLVLGRPVAVSAALRETTLTTIRSSLTGAAVPAAVAALAGSSGGGRNAVLALVVALAAACGLAWALHGPAPTGPQYSDPTPPADQTVVPPTPAIDGRDDPLPPGAIARLGTRRFQVPTYPMQPLSVAGGKAYLVYHVEPATDRGEYRWMDAETGKVQDTWPVPAGREPLGVSPDGRWALLGVRRVITTGVRLTKEEKPDLSFTLYLYDLTLRREVKILHGKLEEGEWHVRHGRFSTDGKWLVTVGGGVRLWDLGTGKEVWAIHQRKGPGQPLDCLGFTPDKAQLILRDPDKGSIHVVDVAQGKIVHEFTPEVGDRPVGTLLAPDGTALLMNLQTPEIRAWDVTTGKELAPLTGAKKLTRVFAFAPDGKTLVSGGVDSFVLVRDWPSGKVRRQLELGRDCVQNLFVSADGKTLNVVFWWENTLHRYDLGSGKPLAVPAETHRAEVFGVVAAADGSILSLGQDSVLRTWDPTTAKQICQARLDRTPAWAPFALSPDGKQIAYADYGMVSVSIVDRETGKLLRTIATAGREIDRVIFSPDGQFLAGSGRDAKVVRVWDMKTGGDVATLAAAKGGWWSGSPDFTFSPDGKLFVATEEGCVQVRGTRNWKPCGNFAAYPSGLVFSPDGRTLACASLNSVSVWEVATWQLRATLPSKAHPSYLPLFSPDGRYLAWTNSAETIEIWDLFRNQRVAEFRGHDNRIKAMTFTRDGRRLVSASEDCTLLVWDVAGAAAVANGDPGPRRPK